MPSPSWVMRLILLSDIPFRERQFTFIPCKFQLPLRKCVLSTLFFFLNKNVFKVFSLSCTSVDFLSFHKVSIIFYKSELYFCSLFSFYYIFSSVDVKGILIFPCQNNEKNKSYYHLINGKRNLFSIY